MPKPYVAIPQPTRMRHPTFRHCQTCHTPLYGWGTRKNPTTILCKSCGARQRINRYNQQKQHQTNTKKPT